MISEFIKEVLRLRRYYARYITSFLERATHVTRRALFGWRIYILADSETDSHALPIQRALSEGRIGSKIASRESYSERFWRIPIVVYSGKPDRLPRKYVILQTQDLSSRESIDDDYLQILTDALAVLDFSTINIERLLAAGMSYKRLFYVPFKGNMWCYLARFLLAIDCISYAEFHQKAATYQSINGNSRICLSLPETIARRRAFDDRRGNFAFFDGLRHKYGWVGCGMSYKYICQAAMQQGLEYLIVVEDDALLPESFERELEVVLSYLSLTADPWHVFSGFIANLDKKVEASNVVRYGGIDFIHMNKLTSTVCNIYHRSIFEKLSKWDEQNYHFYTNTIDRYLGNWKQLKVITTIPFLVGHREDLVSSVWGFENARYSPMVAETIQRLSGLVRTYKSGEK
jgi:hypothetical protein